MANSDEPQTDLGLPVSRPQPAPDKLPSEALVRPSTAGLHPSTTEQPLRTRLHVAVGEVALDELNARRSVPEPPGEITPQEKVAREEPPGSETRPLRGAPPRTTVLDPAVVQAQLGALRRSPTGGPSFPATSPSAVRAPESLGTSTSSSVRTSGLRSTLWAPSPELTRTIGLLAVEELAPSPDAFLSPDAENPFEGMLNATLELKLPPPPREGVAERSGTFAADLDQVWLGPVEPPGPLLPNAYGLSDEQVSRQFASLFQLDGLEGESLLLVGILGRLEAQLVALLGQVGHDVLGLLQTCRTPEGLSLRGVLEPTGLLTDADVLWALQLWQENRHDARFWADDDGTRQKAARLVGYQVARKRLEPLRQLRLPVGFQSPTLSTLVANIGRLAQLLNERQSMIRQHFAARAACFNAGFLVQRGLNAQVGFFWLQPVREGL